MNPAFLFRTLADFAAARFSGETALQASGASERILCPEETERVRPAIMVDGAFERFSEFVDDAQRSRLTASFFGGETIHAPTRAYTFHNARIAAGSAFADGFRYRIRPPREAGFPKRFERFESIALCTGVTSDHFFGHCLNEDLPQMLLADEFGGPARLTSKNWPDLLAYRQVFGLNWAEIDAAEIDSLTVFWDFSQNSSRKQRFRDYRARMRRALTGDKPGGRYYLRRGDTGAARSPVNDDAVAEALNARGYDIIDIVNDDSVAFLKSILDRSVIVSVEGSHMMHLVYTLKENGAGLAFLPPNRPRQALKDACDAIGARFGTVVGYPAEGGYRIDIDELNRTLDMLEREAGL